jgi:glycerol uptake facilitator-like aquaporin
MQDAFGGTVSWAQVPTYLIGEVVGGVLGGLAYTAIGRVRADAAMTSLAPDEGPDAEAALAAVPAPAASAETGKPQQRLSGATS